MSSPGESRAVAPAVVFMVLCVVALASSACFGGDSELGKAVGTAVGEEALLLGPPSQFENRFGSGNQSYTATWLVDPTAAGLDDPSAPYQYSEFVSDADGSYRIQTPRHYVIQTVSDVYICATDGIVTCARAPRQDGAPNTASVGVSTLRRFSPEAIYEVSSDLALRVAEIREPDAWSSSQRTHGTNISVECWSTIGPTPTAPQGFEVCYTTDDARLMASLDLTGDGSLEVDLTTYFSGSEASQFAPPTSFEDDQRVYEQLVDLFPDVPLPPEPTPDPDAPQVDGEDGSPDQESPDGTAAEPELDTTEAVEGN